MVLKIKSVFPIIIHQIKGVVLIIQWGKRLTKITVCVTVFEMMTFSIFTKIQDGG